MTAQLLHHAAPPSPVAPLHRGPHLRVMVMARPAVAWLGLVWCATHTLLALGAGIWLADSRMLGVIALAAAGAACFRWYLRYPVGMYEPATNTYITIWPYGIRCRLRPGDPARSLVACGGRIVESGEGGRTVLRRVLIRQHHWAMIVQSMRTGSGRGARIPSRPVRPVFITARQRRTGLAVVVLAAFGLIALVAVVCKDLLAAGIATTSLVDALDNITLAVNVVETER